MFGVVVYVRGSCRCLCYGRNNDDFGITMVTGNVVTKVFSNFSCNTKFLPISVVTQSFVQFQDAITEQVKLEMKIKTSPDQT